MGDFLWGHRGQISHPNFPLLLMWEIVILQGENELRIVRNNVGPWNFCFWVGCALKKERINPSERKKSCFARSNTFLFGKTKVVGDGKCCWIGFIAAFLVRFSSKSHRGNSLFISRYKPPISLASTSWLTLLNQGRSFSLDIE